MTAMLCTRCFQGTEPVQRGGCLTSLCSVLTLLFALVGIVVFWPALLLALFFAVPALGVGRPKAVCRHCSSSEIVPLDSPRARLILETQAARNVARRAL